MTLKKWSNYNGYCQLFQSQENSLWKSDKSVIKRLKITDESWSFHSKKTLRKTEFVVRVS